MFDDPELEAVFARASPADTLAAVLTEARAVLAEVDSPLDAELWGSDILAAFHCSTTTGDEVPMPNTKRPGARPASVAPLIAIRPGPRV